MAASRRAPPTDPEFDPSPVAPVRLRDFDPLEHQRLVVNPFLAVLGLIGLCRLAQALADSPLPGLTALVVVPMVILPYLIQYHCLDCGRTGTYPRRRAHACSGVLIRWNEGRPSRFPFPFPSGHAQLVVWGWVLGAVALILAITTWT